MNARSAEFLATAQQRLRTAATIADQDPAAALSAAYYAALYAARGALSEHDVQARTHRGTWHEFRRRFVLDGSVPETVATEMLRLQSVREQADYDAAQIPAEQAHAAIDAVRAFVDAVSNAL